jgi:hypothetical protein
MAILLFAVTLRGGFAYDFYGIARDDVRLRDPAQWRTYWTQTYNGGVDNLYRPLTSMAFAVQAYVNGLDETHAWRFHLLSILMHAGVSALVAEFARRLANARVALVAGLLFAAHPIHVEVLGDIVGQAELMCALGTLGAMVLFLHHPMTPWRALAMFGCFIFALLSKEQGMLLPALLLLLALTMRFRRFQAPPAAQCPALQGRGPLVDYSNRSTTRSDQGHKNAQRLLVLLLCWSLGAYIFIREHYIAKFWWDRSFLDWTINPLVLSHGRDRVLMPIVLLGRYTQLLIFPWKLAPDYSGVAIGSAAHLDDPYLWLGFLAIVAWLSLCATAVFKRAAVSLFCLIALAMMYGLVGNIVTIIGTNFAERLMYLPSVFIVILIAMALAKLPTRPLVATMIVIISLSSIRTFTYARRWNDRVTLYESAIRDQPGAVRMYMMLAAEYLERGENQKAIETIQRAQRVTPNYARLWTFSAAVALKLNDFETAQRYIERAGAMEPSMQVAAVEQQIAEKRAATQKSN